MPQLQKPSRVLIQSEAPLSGLNVNGVVPGMVLAELEETLVQDVTLDHHSGFLMLLDAKNGTTLKLFLRSEGNTRFIERVETDHRGTLLNGDIPLISCLDPIEQVKGLPHVQVKESGSETVITSPDSSFVARLTGDTMVRKIVLE